MGQKEKIQVKNIADLEVLLINDIRIKYGIQVLNIKKMELGTAKCYEINADKKKYFVKIYQKKHDCKQISREIRICDYLKKRGMSVSEYIKNSEGNYINIQEYGIFTVQNFIDGITYEKFHVPMNILYQSGEILAQIHDYLDKISTFNVDFSPEWIRKMADGDENMIKLEGVIKSAEKMPDHQMKSIIIEDCDWKLKMLPELSKWKQNFGNLTRKNSHGDYNTYQWICEDNKIKAIIDFGSCSNVPVVWELIRSYTYAVSECAKGEKVDAASYCNYLQYYLRNSTLSYDDLQRGFSFYYYTLLPSTFGYKQYIEDYKKGQYNDLIEFALCRSRMCRYLYSHAEFLDEYVYKKIKMEL